MRRMACKYSAQFVMYKTNYARLEDRGAGATEIKNDDAKDHPYKNKGLAVSEVRDKKPQENGQRITETGCGNLPA